MKRILSIILLILMLSTVFSGCRSLEPESTLNGTNITKSNVDSENWSIFVYLCGSDLETNGGLAAANLLELLEVNQTSNVKVLIVDRSACVTDGTYITWHKNDIS